VFDKPESVTWPVVASTTSVITEYVAVWAVVVALLGASGGSGGASIATVKCPRTATR
jgi:hypothetical protein